MPDCSVEKMCRGKWCYTSRDDAKAKMRNGGARRAGGVTIRIEAYKCAYCPFWHTGHAVRNRKERATVKARKRREGVEA